MSYQVRVVIVCDEGACTTQFAKTYVNQGGLTAAWALRMASDAGWSVGAKGKTLCPTHRQPIQTHPFEPDRFGNYCEAKVRGKWCFKRQSHPVHAV